MPHLLMLCCSFGIKSFSAFVAFRYWLPNGVPLSLEEHNLIHSSDKRGRELEEFILKIKGEDWINGLKQRRTNMVDKNKRVTYKKVLRYFNNKLDDYI